MAGQPVRDPHAADRRAAQTRLIFCRPNRYWAPNGGSRPEPFQSGIGTHGGPATSATRRYRIGSAMRGASGCRQCLSLPARACTVSNAFDNKAAIGDHRLRHGSNYPLWVLPESHSMVHIRQGLHWRICRAKTHALSVHSLSQMSRSCRSCQQSSYAAPPALAASDPRCAVPRIFSFGLQNTATTNFIQ